jgi:hypothetical protein
VGVGVGLIGFAGPSLFVPPPPQAPSRRQPTTANNQVNAKRGRSRVPVGGVGELLPPQFLEPEATRCRTGRSGCLVDFLLHLAGIAINSDFGSLEPGIVMVWQVGEHHRIGEHDFIIQARATRTRREASSSGPRRVPVCRAIGVGSDYSGNPDRKLASPRGILPFTMRGAVVPRVA